MPLDRAARTGIALGALALVAFPVCHLALTDIQHGEGDLSLEWGALRLAFAVMLVSQCWALAVLTRIARGSRHRRDAPPA